MSSELEPPQAKDLMRSSSAAKMSFLESLIAVQYAILANPGFIFFSQELFETVALAKSRY